MLARGQMVPWVTSKAGRSSRALRLIEPDPRINVAGSSDARSPDRNIFADASAILAGGLCRSPFPDRSRDRWITARLRITLEVTLRGDDPRPRPHVRGSHYVGLAGFLFYDDNTTLVSPRIAISLRDGTCCRLMSRGSGNGALQGYRTMVTGVYGRFARGECLNFDRGGVQTVRIITCSGEVVRGTRPGFRE